MAALSDQLVQELLNGRYVATLGTRNEDGSAHLTAVWYILEAGQLYIATSSHSRKLRNVQARPTASLMVDSRSTFGRGVTCAGPAEVLTGDAALQTNLRIYRRYMSEAAIADPKVGPVFAQLDDVTIRIKPESIFSWDLVEIDRTFFGGAVSTPGYLLPLER
jgi:PPOX class probable F420-dependent enzyme